MEISVIIVTYHSAKFITPCIYSLLNQKEVTLEVIIVDNASQDDTNAILERFRDQIHYIKSSQNLGFGKANNLGSQVAKGKWLFLLNPDTEIPDEFGLKKLLQFAEANPRCGLIGTAMVSPDGKKETKPFDYYPGEAHISSPFKVLSGKIAWVLGASLFLLRETYRQVQGFDEDFFLYGEDADICLRIRKLGYEIGYCSKVVVQHIGGASEKGVVQYDRTLKKQKALYLFYKKHYPASDVIFLLKREWRRAAFRRRWYCFLRRVTLGVFGQRREEKQKAIEDSSREFLQQSDWSGQSSLLG